MPDMFYGLIPPTATTVAAIRVPLVAVPAELVVAGVLRE